MALAKFLHGDPHYVNENGLGQWDVSQYSVLEWGGSTYVAHVDVNSAASDLTGQRAEVAESGGSYEVEAGGPISPGAAVYWDADATDKFVASPSNTLFFGFCHPDSGAAQDGDMIHVTHHVRQ